MQTSATLNGSLYSTPQYAYSTADIERGLFYGEQRSVNTIAHPGFAGMNVVSIGGSYFVVDEVTPAPWQPLTPGTGLMRLIPLK